MHPKNMSAVVLAMGFLFACATMNTNKATSVVDPDKIDAVQELAVWKQKADTSAMLAPSGCESKYSTAQQEIRGWIRGPLTVQIDDMAAQYYGTVDLSKQRIPHQLTVAVGEFQTCAGDVAERGIEDVGMSVLNWASEQAKGQRKQSADALKAQLKSYEWANWTDAKRGVSR
jgi:hypothetical protein